MQLRSLPLARPAVAGQEAACAEAENVLIQMDTSGPLELNRRLHVMVCAGCQYAMYL